MIPATLAHNVILLLRGICFHAEDSKGRWNVTGGRLYITFEPYAGDMRFLMGDGGRCIKGVQHVCQEIAERNDYNASVSLVQKYEGEAPKETHDFEQNPQFDETEIVQVVGNLLASAFGREVRTQPRRSNDMLDILIDVRSAGEKVTLQALSEPLYAYGFRNGCIIKLGALNHG